MSASTYSQAPVQQEPQTYYLRTYPHPDSPSPNPSKHSGLYIRLHGSGTNSVMLTPSPPIYLRGHFELVKTTQSGASEGPVAATGCQFFTSPAERHGGRWWGLLLTTDPRDNKAVAGWHRAEISEGSTQNGWAFESIQLSGDTGEMISREQLVWRGSPLPVSSTALPEQVYEWNGWMACKGTYGHPQLFWLTNKLKDDGLPEGSERVIVVKEYLS